MDKEKDDDTDQTSGKSVKLPPETYKYRLQLTFTTKDRHQVPHLHCKLVVLMEQCTLSVLDYFGKSDCQTIQANDPFWDNFDSYNLHF